MRLVFLGNDPWSVPPLGAVAAAADIETVAVVTNPPKPAGRGGALTPTAVADAARRLGLPLREVDGVGAGEGLAALREAEPDVLVVVAYGEILSAEVLGVATHGAVNLHFSLLPRWRGATPVQRALLAGDAVTGITIIRMDEGMDTGPVLTAREEPISPEDDAGSLGERLARIGGDALVEVLAACAAGNAPASPQVAGGVTYAPKLEPHERWIDWREPAAAVVNRVRAFAPDPGATTRVRDVALKVLRAEVSSEEAPPADPGTIVAVDKDGLLVAAGTGVVKPLEVAPSGRKRMPASAWLRGARLEPGERFG